jgi:recombination protein RecA
MSDVSQQIKKVLQKKHGSSYHQGDAPSLERIRSEIPGLDRLLGGGLPCGRAIEMFGDPSVGKTTMALVILKTLLQKGYDVAYNDLELTIDHERLQEMGVGGENFHYLRPYTGKEAIEVFQETINCGAKAIVFDSVPYLATDAFYEAEPGDQVMAPQATFLSRNQPTIVQTLEYNNAIGIFINQTRNKIGSYGNPVDSSGGNALNFLCSVRLRMTRSGMFKDGSGFVLKFKTERNKVGLEKQSTVLNFEYNGGPNPYSSMRETLQELDMLYSQGANFYLSKDLSSELGLEIEKVGYGKPRVESYFRDNPEIYEKLYQKILQN